MNPFKNFRDYYWWIYYSIKQKLIRKLAFPESSFHRRKNNIFEVETKSIKFLAGGLPQKNYKLRRTDMDLVIGGDWDYYGNKVEDDIFFISSVEHFIEKLPWTKTEFVKRQLKTKTKIELYRYLRDKTRLYYSMKKRGYINNSLLNPKIQSSRFNQGWSEIGIHIGKKGDFLLCQGRHRLFFAYLLNISHVEVNIIVRHKEWYESEINKGIFT